jgi:hypothetical protein
MEPTSSSIAAFAATLSAMTVALLGVDSYSVMYSALGAYLAVLHSKDPSMPRLRVFITVILTTLIGAALGTAAFEVLAMKIKPVLFVSCIVGGFGAQAILAALLNKTLGRIGEQGSSDNGGKP